MVFPSSDGGAASTENPKNRMVAAKMIFALIGSVLYWLSVCKSHRRREQKSLRTTGCDMIFVRFL
jgi:hypothetical protein